MTTTISLATRDCIVLGSDSLATSSSAMVNPFSLANTFFEADGTIKRGADGQPLLNQSVQLKAFLEHVPTDQLPNVTKLFSLHPIHAGVLFSGASAIGDWSIKNLIDAFKITATFTTQAAVNYEIENVAQALFVFLKEKYDQAHAGIADEYKPSMEVVLSGYSRDYHQPEIFRLKIGPQCECPRELERGKYNIIFSGQYDVIQRVMLGIDLNSYLSLSDKSERLLNRYHEKLNEFLKQQGVNIDLPPPDMSDGSLQLFAEGFGGVKGLYGDRGSLSEQAAINLVEFLIDTMIRAQQFSGSIPTVGGDIHLAILTKASGFKWISKEQYLFRGHSVPKHDHPHA